MPFVHDDFGSTKVLSFSCFLTLSVTVFKRYGNHLETTKTLKHGTCYMHTFPQTSLLDVQMGTW